MSPQAQLPDNVLGSIGIEIYCCFVKCIYVSNGRVRWAYERTDLEIDEMSIPSDTSCGDKDGEARGGNRPVDRL